jgi:hypothetical protein
MMVRKGLVAAAVVVVWQWRWGLAVAAAVIHAKLAVEIFARKQWLWQPSYLAAL